MKRNLNLFLGFCLSSFISFSQIPTFKNEQIPVAAPKGKNVIEIPSTFAKGFVDDKEILSLLENKEIKRIELYYTQFKENPSFDQQALNEKRVKELLEKYPQLKNQKIVWVWKEQTLAQTKTEAANCFHGFRIYGVEKKNTKGTVNENAQNNSPKNFKGKAFEDKGNEPVKFTIDARKGGDFTAPSGSIVHVPANAVVDKNGKLVQGDFTVEYTEYRNPAEIAFSGIPMHFSENGVEFQMNSAGMYKLNGLKNGEELKLVKDIKVDFNLTERLADLNFYSLNSKTNEWEKVKSIGDESSVKNDIKIEYYTTELFLNYDPEQSMFVTNQKQYNSIYSNNGTVTVKYYPYQWSNYINTKIKFPKDFEDLKINELAKEYTIVCSNEVYEKVETKIGEFIQIQHEEMKKRNEVMTKMNNMIYGLIAPNFGVYNCDQQKRISNQITLQPTLFNKATKSKIENLYSVNVIDRSLNASFSFSPTSFVINKFGNTDLVFFDNEGKIYILEAKELKNVDLKNGKIDLYLSDISNQVKTSDDLKSFLKL